MCGGRCAQVLCQQQLVLRLARGTICDTKEPCEFTVARTPTPLCNIRRHRGCGSAKLSGQPEALIVREALGVVIDVARQRVRFVPDFQLLEIPHLLSLPSVGQCL